jgi:hypothetical protein
LIMFVDPLMAFPRNFLLSFLLILLFKSTCVSQPGWPETTSENKPWTRWWWLGSAVDKPGLSHNLESLQRAGFGGVELSFIYGVKGNEKNEVGFLTPAWMGLMQHTIDEASRLDMGVDMNNVTGWPFGGPHISYEHAASRAFFQRYQLSSGQKLTEPITINEA